MASPQPPKDFTFHPSLAKFNVPFEELLTTLNSRVATPLDGLATGAVVFKTSRGDDDPDVAAAAIAPRVLLVQRSSTDSMPNKWEIPGGAVDPGETILGGAVREVFEESGLSVREIVGLVGHDNGDDDGGDEGAVVERGYLFHTTRGRRIVKFTFVVDVGDEAGAVRLDPDEHQDCVWATEEECRVKRAARTEDERDAGKGAVVLDFTTLAQEAAILRAFSELKKGGGETIV